MAQKKLKKMLLLAALVALAAAALLLLGSREDEPRAGSSTNGGAAPREDAPPAAARPGPEKERLAPAAPPGGDKTGAVPSLFMAAPWGAELGALGRERPEEGNPEGPMSFVATAGGAVVLDQVNGRIVRYDREGRPLEAIPLTQQAPQDLQVTRDGRTVVMDRLVDKTVAVLGKDGALLGELPVAGKGIEEVGDVTGLFVDGEDVYVERENGPLVRVGDTSGTPDPERPELPGRPSRDGKSLLLAGLVDPAAGRLFVSSIDRATGDSRFTRELRLGMPTPTIVLLDTDRQGIIHLAALVESAPAAKADEPPELTVKLICLAPTDGQPLGTADLPANTLPEETFRDLAVLDEGGVLYALRTEAGVSYRRAACR